MRLLPIGGCIFCITLAAACGGNEPSASAPSVANDESAATGTSQAASSKPAPSAEGAPLKPSDSETPAPKTKADVPTPAFKENGSVLEAVNAVPQGTPRLNVEQEALARPLNNVELYEPCKPGNAHFKAKVAIWDGKAVGLDLTTTPKNQKFADCIAERIRGITWADKVKSLNTVEYTF